MTVLLFISMTSSPGYIHSQAANTKENRDYKYAAGLYTEGMYDMAIRELERFIDAYPESDKLAYAQFLLAGSYFYKKNFDQSIKITTRLRREHPATDIMDKILFLQGRAHFQKKQYTQVVNFLIRIP